ncbi:MAG: SIMPL domain-containing protein [bacterium]|jgi:uncharacterized protein YggE
MRMREDRMRPLWRRAPALIAVPALVAGVLLPACAARAQEPGEPPRPTRDRTITVTGTGVVEREPDQAVIMLAVENRAETAEAAARANAETMDRVIAAVRRLGIERDRIRTASYQLHPEYARDEPRPGQTSEPRVVGYRAMNMVRVTVDDIARVGEVIDAALGAGANRVTGLSFQLRDPERARLDALALAVQNARAEAQALASALGETLGPALDVSTTGRLPQPVPYLADAVLARTAEFATAPTPIEPGTLRVEATVTIVYRLQPR